MVVMENVGQQKLRQMLDYCQSIDRYRHAQSYPCGSRLTHRTLVLLVEGGLCVHPGVGAP